MIRVGLIGLGFIGTTVGRDIDETDEAEVVALADVDGESLRNGGELFDISETSRYADYREMLATESLDAVLIGTPHTLHYEQVVAALERDLHVLCEKPLTTDIEQGRDLVERAERSGGSLTVGYQRRVRPPYRHARRYVSEDKLTPAFVTAGITQDWINEQRGKWRADPELSGGGQLYDTGSHLVDIVIWMTGMTPVSVSAEMAFEDDAERIDTQAMLTIVGEDGELASISVSGDSPAVREHVNLWGPEGGLSISGPDWGARELETIGLPAPELANDSDDLPAKGERFIEAIQHGRKPFATAKEALMVTAVTEAAYESARSGRRVEVPSFDRLLSSSRPETTTR